MTEEQMNELAQNLMEELALGDNAQVRSVIVFCFKKVQDATRAEAEKGNSAMSEKNKVLEQSNNVANARMHKHCIFCGISSDAGGLVGAICPSKNNTFPPNTVGDRPHAYPVASTPHPAAPTDPYAKMEMLVKHIELHCPCGARPESPNTHPHIGGCPVAELIAAIAELRAGEGRNG